MNSRWLNCLLLLVPLTLVACGNETGKKAAPAPGAQPKTSSTTESTPAPSAKETPSPAATSVSGEPNMAPMPGTTTRDTELKDSPFIDAKTLRTLPSRTAVTIVDRSGGWYKVVSGGRTGWVRLLHVSSQPAAASASSKEELEAAAKLVTGRAGGGNIVSTTGIRGLSEEQLRKARPNPVELRRLQSYGVTPDQASVYARANNLERRQVAQLPPPS